MAEAKANKSPKTKKYVVVKSVDKPSNYKGTWKVGEVIRIIPSEFIPYIEGRMIVPYATIADAVVPKPVITSPSAKSASKTSKKESSDSSTQDGKTPQTEKQLIGNTLADAIQQKKSELADAEKEDSKTEATTTTEEKAEDDTTTEEAKKTSLSAEKLAAIKAGGKK